MELFDQIQQTAAYIREQTNFSPKVGIVLGSGLGDVTADILKEAEIPYSAIPNFPVSTVQGHEGKLLMGYMGRVPVMLMAGRFHYYEGYTMKEVTFPVRVMRALGVEVLILSNAAGGTNPAFNIGDLMIIKDHINQFPEHPLRGPNDDRLGTRFPDMGQAYDHQLIDIAREIAAEKHIDIRTGVYLGLQGPTFETPAEYRWIHTIGADAVGMSTVPEVIVARHGGMRVFAISVITDIGITDVPVTITHEEVLEAAHAAAPKMSALVAGVIEKIGELALNS